LYKEWDQGFPEEETTKGRIDGEMAKIMDLKELYRSAIYTRGGIYSLFAALAHVRGGIPKEDPLPSTVVWSEEKKTQVIFNLAKLAEAVEGRQVDGAFGEFVRASGAGTNTETNRRTRFKWMCRALTESF
jgi:hypothetical protein